MFITLEGPEGCGKSSQMPFLAEYLRGAGYEVIVTREPGGTFVGDQIRDVLMNLENVSILPRTEILLFLAARAQHVDELIKPALAEDKIVICDRYGDSTLAYQGYGHQVDIETLRQLLKFSTDGLKPDLTLLIDIPVKIGFERKRENNSEWNRLDAYTEAFHNRVRQGYFMLVEEDSQRWVIIDGNQDKEMVQAAMRDVVIKRLDKN